jgi:hypothetical protein
MITANNYGTTTDSINFTKAPAALREGHNSFNDLREFYSEDADIKETIDLYLKQLNSWVSSNGSKHEAKPKKEKPVKDAKTSKAKFKAGQWVMDDAGAMYQVSEIKTSGGSHSYILKYANGSTSDPMSESELEIVPKNSIPSKKKAVKIKTVKPAKAARVAKPVKKKAAPKTRKAKAPKKAKAIKICTKPAKPLKRSTIKTPELVLIKGFMELNKRSASIKSFETKLQASTHLETIKHKDLIGEIKAKLKKGIEAAKADTTSNGFIKATIDPNFLAKCREAIKNATELFRVSYIGGVKKKR